MVLPSIPIRKWRSRSTRSAGKTGPGPTRTGTISAWPLCFSFIRSPCDRQWERGRPGHGCFSRRAAPGSPFVHRGFESVSTNRYRRSVQYRMGSPFEITVYGEEGVCSKAMAAAFSEIARVERLMTVYHPESPLAEANRFSRAGFFPVPPELLQILSKALHYAESSRGAFDPTAGPLVSLWGFGPGKESASPPGEAAIRSSLQRVGYEKVQIDLEAGGIRFLQGGIEFNLGGLGK